MKIRTRLILAMLTLICMGFAGLIYWILSDMRPRYLATMEESMVDMATVLATQVEQDVNGQTINVEPLRVVMNQASVKRFDARIFEEVKTRLELRVYVTDRRGIILFDSDQGRQEGVDNLRFLDVGLSLKGEYGARTTPLVKGDQATSVLYVGSPIRDRRGEIIGVLTVCKEAKSATRFLFWARQRVIFMGVFVVLAVALLVLIVSSWLTTPIDKLTRYAQAVRDGHRASLPPLGRNEMGRLGEAFEEMRDALEGKEYVSQYVQTLTHEMKSPLSAIRGAAELLEEQMPLNERIRFLENIRAESGRIQGLIDRLLQLSALEKRKDLLQTERLDATVLVHEILVDMEAVLSSRGLRTVVHAAGPMPIRAERFWTRQALVNLLQNAIDFSPADGTITIALQRAEALIEISLADQGPGLPDYAHERVFERFYSCKRPGSGKKSSGLGLSIVREVVALHGGTARLENIPGGGARATVSFPAA